MILNKPSGIAVHNGSNNIKYNIIDILREFRPKIKFLELVHRLDFETSGVLLIAKKRITLHVLHEQLRNRKIKKTYLALVKNHCNNNVNLITAPIYKKYISNKKYILQVNHEKGKLSETYFIVKECFKIATLIKAIPITGRTHQIRIHAQYAGHPIAYDTKYGDLQFNQVLKNIYPHMNRLFLHASCIYFEHPKNGKFIKIKASLDITLINFLKFLRVNYNL